MSEEVVMCSGGCGKFWPLAGVLAGECPWERLTIKPAVRCGECNRALAGAPTGAGVAATYAELAPTDRGALKPLPPAPPLREAPGQSSGALDWDEP